MAARRTGTIYSAKKLHPKRIRPERSRRSRRILKVTAYPTKFFGSQKGPLRSVSLFLEAIGKPIYELIFLTVNLLIFAAALIFKLITNTVYRLVKSGKEITRVKMFSLKIAPPKLPIIRLPLIKVALWGIVLILFSSAGFTIYGFFSTLPDPNKLVTRRPVVSTKIYDRNGTLLYKIYLNQNRTLIELKDVPKNLIQATIAIEDAEFYNHHGLSPKGIFSATLRNLKGKKLYGGSTITQQLVKNALLTPERSWRRKIKELVLALMVEAKFSKDQILQMYLNEVGYGGAAYGIEEASQAYFGKAVHELNLAEATLLAGLPASPTNYSPFGAHPEKANERQKLVLQRMRQEGFINENEEKTAGAFPLQFARQKTDIKAPHFVMYIKDLLVQQYGERMVEEGGLEVKTSLDLSIQQQAEIIINQELERIKNLHITNGAALVTNPATGEILAMIGSNDYFDDKNDGNVNVTIRPRQPGSSIKPINYSIALENGFTPATILSDTPITYQIPGQPPYSPKNYDSRFHGNVPLRTALASSYNVPAVKVLSAFGVQTMVKRGQDMGITTWDDPSRFGLSLTLGGGEIKMVDLAVVYGTLANMGTRVNLNPILEVKDYRGRILKTNHLSLPTRVLTPSIAYILTDILADNNARAPAFGPRSWLNIANHSHVAVKTGTTQNMRDNWTIGYTPDYLVAVWVGNNDNSPMSYVASGITGASPIWNKIMSVLLTNIPDKEFPKPEYLKEVEICSTTGTLPCEGCQTKKEIFLPGTEPKYHCNSENLGKPLEENYKQILSTTDTNDSQKDKKKKIKAVIQSIKYLSD